MSEENKDVNYLDMDDDVFDPFDVLADDPIEESPTEDKVSDDKNEEESTEEGNPSEEEAKTEDTSTEEVKEVEPTSGDDNSDIEDEVETPKDSDLPNYEEIGKLVFEPFKAEGKQVQIRNKEDLQRLLSLGASYTQRNQKIAPHLATIKTLENNGLLNDNNTLNLLIDLHNKKPEAIKNYLASLPDDLDVNDLTSDFDDPDTPKQDYVPTDYSVDPKTIQVDQVLDQLKNSEHYNEMLDVVGNKWDEESRTTVREAPQILNVINEHFTNGTYPEVMKVIDNRALLGDPVAGTAIQQYFTIALQLEEAKESQAKAKETTPKVKTTGRSPKKVAIDSSTTSSNDGTNYLDMPDDEVEKLFNDM